ncbi:MAG: gliding motility-associated C-terminal domain-containing protein [Flavobacteriales bacterium]|nr:MAG: gliding motility-associated C-terminal domain-containing protein [Flavobacteriales bacterium]
MVFRPLSLVALAFAAQAALAQTIVNGDCENTTAATCQYNLGNPGFNAFMPDVVAYGGGNEVDIQQNGCNYGTPTPSGQFFISLANSVFGSPGDEVYFVVSPPFVAGSTYTISWLEQANTQFRPLDSLEIGVSDVAASFGTRISITQPVDNVWTQRTATFTAPFTAGFLTVRNLAPFEAWNFIDIPTVVCALTVDLGNDTTICAGSNVQLDATTPNVNYLWSDGNTGATLNASATGQYWVTISDSTCSATDTINITVATSLPLALGNDSTLCTGDTLGLHATTPNSTYLWSDGSTNATLAVSTTGTYWATADNGTCLFTDTVDITFVAPPMPTLGNDTSICSYDQLLLDPNEPGSTFLWSNGTTGATLLTNAGTLVWVEADNGTCIARDSITIGSIAPPLVSLPADTAVCEGELVVLDATAPGATYLWSDGSAASFLVVDVAGTYWVNVTAQGCTASDTTQLTVGLPALVDIGNDSLLCPGYRVEVSAEVPGATYLWNTGETSATILAMRPDTFIVWVTLGPCTSSDTLALTFDDVECACPLFAPNTITPDGDGINDRFAPQMPCPADAWELMIFNRWGERIFTSNAQSSAWEWDGAAAVPDGVYIWQLNFRPRFSSESRQARGHVTVLR